MPALTSRAPVEIGAVIDGRYQIESILGAGGMGIVFRAQHLELRQSVAVKMPFAETAQDPEVVERLLREARAAVRLRSEHVCRVLDVGRAAGGLPYVVFEYLDGTSLSAYLRRKGQLPLEEIWRFLLEVCDAVGEAHRLGIVHRDLKPLNLFLVRGQGGRKKIKVLDFGISKTVNPEMGDDRLTESSTLLGTPSYIAPEQMSDTRSVDARADVWALGICAYELVTGRVPFKGASVMDLAVRIAGDPVPLPSGFRGDLPPALERIILRCLEKDRANRYASANELAAALVAAAPPMIAQAFMHVQGDGGDVPSYAMRAAPAVVRAGAGTADDEGTPGATSATLTSAIPAHALLAATVQERSPGTAAAERERAAPPDESPPLTSATSGALPDGAARSASRLRRAAIWPLALVAVAILVVGGVRTAASFRSPAIASEIPRASALPPEPGVTSGSPPPPGAPPEPTPSGPSLGSAPQAGPAAGAPAETSAATAMPSARVAPSGRSLAARPAKPPRPPSPRTSVDEDAIPRSR
jgi:hypothetical protein